MENIIPSVSKDSDNNSGMKVLLSMLWIVSIFLAGIIGFSYGQKNKTPQPQTNNSVLASNQLNITDKPVPPTNMPVSTPIIANTISPTVTYTNTCPKTGFAQKWEYLTAYIVKQNDTLQSIAEQQLNDKTRTNEILQINGVGPLVVDSTLYLPPPSVTKSSGNLKEVYGRLVEKNSVSWHISFSNDPNGQGILIPTYLFESVSNNDSYKIGDCLKIFFDDGYKVFSVSGQ